MGFNLLGGLNAAGGAIAQTAGMAALELQRSQLEKDKIALAESLAEGRESRGREQQADLNAKAADTDYKFRAGESLLNRTHETDLTNIRETGENTRLDKSEAGANKRAAMSEGSANKRFDKEMEFRVSQAQQAVQDKKDQRALDGAIAAATSTTMEEYLTAGGDKATRPVKTFDPDKAAKILNTNGYPDLAKPFMVPKEKAAAPVEGSTVRQNGHTFKVINGQYVPQD